MPLCGHFSGHIFRRLTFGTKDVSATSEDERHGRIDLRLEFTVSGAQVKNRDYCGLPPNSREKSVIIAIIICLIILMRRQHHADSALTEAVHFPPDHVVDV